jgi:hypothetical protein
MTQKPVPAGETPRPSISDMQRALASELSVGARIGHTLLLLTSFSVAAVTAALVLTEPALPPATLAALVMVTVVGLAWTAFAGWVLTRRRVLFASHRIVAARMAVAFSALYTVGAALLGPQGAPAWYAAMAVGVAMLGAAIALLVRARNRFRQLSAQRAGLERQLASQGGRQ